MSRLLVRLLAAVLTCEGVVLSLLVAAIVFLEHVGIETAPEPPPVWVDLAQGAGVALWVVVLGAGARALWTGRYRTEQGQRRLLYAVVGGHFVVSLALPVWLGGLFFDRRDVRAALVFWLLGLACWAALRFASPRPEKPSSQGRRERPRPAN
jgi:MFS family permease